MENLAGMNDLLPNIMSRLSIKRLLWMKCLSNEWRRFISDLTSDCSFIRQHLKRTEPTSGFFYQERFILDDDRDDGFRFLSYIPAEKGDARVQRSVFDFLGERVIILGSSNGLVCCRSCFPEGKQLIYICNPIQKEWVSLPYPVYDTTCSLAFAFDPFSDPIHVSTNFKLIKVRKAAIELGDSLLEFDVYSSQDRAWRRSVEICQLRHNLYKNNGLFVGGILYWLTDGDQIMMFHVKNELSLLITVPIARAEYYQSIPEMCIGEGEGKLHYVFISVDGLEVWVLVLLEDYITHQWMRKYSVSLEMLERKNPLFLNDTLKKIARRVIIDIVPWIDPLIYKDGQLFMRVSTDIFLYDFGTGKMKKLCPLSMLGANYMRSPVVFPYTASLVKLDNALRELGDAG